MSDSTPDKPIADPASQYSRAADTSIVPDLTADVAEEERSRTSELNRDDGPQ